MGHDRAVRQKNPYGAGDVLDNIRVFGSKFEKPGGSPRLGTADHRSVRVVDEWRCHWNPRLKIQNQHLVVHAEPRCLGDVSSCFTRRFTVAIPVRRVNLKSWLRAPCAGSTSEGGG